MMPDITEAVRRIERMEEIFDALLEDPAGNRELLGTLREYYLGGQWLEDYALDEAGALPPDLKRGVLSQDGVYDLLDELV